MHVSIVPFTLGVLIRFQSALGQIALSVNAHQSGSIQIDSIHIHMVDWNRLRDQKWIETD